MQLPVFISSTSTDLGDYRSAAADVVRDVGWVPIMMEHFGTDPVRGIVESDARRVEEADLVLAIIAWRRGNVPTPDQGGDGRSSYTKYELDRAFDCGKPVVVMMASESWPGNLWEEDQDDRAWVRNFRGSLDRVAKFFEWDDLDAFRTIVRQELVRYQQDISGLGGAADQKSTEVGLRPWPAPALPDRPYPLLLPYDHPALFAGRVRELAELRRRLHLPFPILGIHAPSGTGKSSLLFAGLIPALREAGHPVAFVRRPAEPGVADLLVGDLLAAPDDAVLAPVTESEPQPFVEYLLTAKGAAEKTPILVLDQFEDVLRPANMDSRAALGMLLASSVRRQPGDQMPCRWVLAYRQEFHGRVITWLADVLHEARGKSWPMASRLPHDLFDRFHSWSLPPLGTPAPGSDAVREATRTFQEAITTPLTLQSEDGTPHFPWRFEGDGATRLAEAFALSRSDQPKAPLVPELQVVLAHLLEKAGKPGERGTAGIDVPEALDELVDRALEDHLHRALDEAFRGEPRSVAREGRTRVLLALRELVDEQGKRVEGLPADELAKAIGKDGEEVLRFLASRNVRVILPQEHSGGLRYALSHDQLADVIVRLVAEKGRRRGPEYDEKLLEMHRFVALDTELFLEGEDSQATAIPGWRFRRIARHENALLWDEDRRNWWEACQSRRRRFRQRVAAWSTLAAVVLSILGVGAAHWVRQVRAFETVRAGDLNWIPTDVSLGERNDEVLKKVATVLPKLGKHPSDLTPIGALAWALDYGPGRDPDRAEEARRLREELLRPLRRLRKPPPLPEDDDPDWVRIPGGPFIMGNNDDFFEDEEPEHPVRLSAFRILRHEVTNREYRRLVKRHDPELDERLPAVNLTWFDAYAYAAWLGGRLPTEAEWELAAGVGCPFKYCKRNGEEATLDEVAWHRKNSGRRLHVVEELEPNQWGLYDMYGNAWEWIADWYARPYPSEAQVDPWGPLTGDGRAIRSFGFNFKEFRAHASYRNVGTPGHDTLDRSFRVVFPLGSEASSRQGNGS